MAHAWDVPSLGGGSFSSDAADIGWQSAFEAGFGSVQIPLAGGEICGYMGLMNSSMILYPEQIILDAEIAMNVYDTYKAFEFKDLDVSLDVIKAVGPGVIICVKNILELICVIFTTRPSFTNEMPKAN